MTRSSKKLRALSVATGLAIVLAAFPNVASARATGSATGTSRSDHERIVAFWTNDRVARATPRDFVFDATTRSFRPRAKPGGGGSSTTLGSSWNAGGEVLDTTGKVLFAMGASYFVCSASVADDAASGRSIILTAAHCAYDETTGKFATNWMFVPDYDSAAVALDSGGVFCARTSLGCWTAAALVVHEGYATAGGFNDQAVVHDFAFAAVYGGGKSGSAQLDATVGGHPIQFSAMAGGADTYLFGYPAAGKYNGRDLVYCRGPLGFDPYTSNSTYRVGCNMTGGSSGGPWFAAFSGGSGTLVSVNSYGYSGIKAMHGPKLNSETAALFATATSTTTNTVVP